MEHPSVRVREISTKIGNCPVYVRETFMQYTYPPPMMGKNYLPVEDIFSPFLEEENTRYFPPMIEGYLLPDKGSEEVLPCPREKVKALPFHPHAAEREVSSSLSPPLEERFSHLGVSRGYVEELDEPKKLPHKPYRRLSA